MADPKIIHLDKLIELVAPGSALRVGRWLDGVDYWDYTSAGTIQNALDTVVEWDPNMGRPSGTQIRNALAPYEIDVLAARDADVLSKLRADKQIELEAYALELIAEESPALAHRDTLGLLAAIWSMLDTSNASNSMNRVKDIYLYLHTKYTQLRTATEAQIRAYVPANDTNWP